MCDCYKYADEEREITQELADRLTKIINEFIKEYHGEMLNHHLVNATGATLIACFRSYNAPIASIESYSEWMVNHYAESYDI